MEGAITMNQQEVIQTFMGVLDTVSTAGVDRLNQAVSVASGGYFTTINDAFEQMVDDCKNAGSADKFLKNYCGIDLSNTDTGAITGSDAGGSTTKTAKSIVPESGSLDTSFSATSFTVNGLTVKLSSSFSALTSTQTYLWRGLKTWWIKGALDLISESYGENFGFGSNSSATVKEINVEFYSANDGTICSTGTFTSIDGKTTGLQLSINTYYCNSVSDSNGAITIGGAEYYLDRTLAHEMTHAVMAANIDNYSELPKIIREGMSELTHGIDDERKSDLQNLAGNSTLLKKALSLSTSYNTVSSVDAPYFAAGYMFLRYLAKQGAENGNYETGEDSMNSISGTGGNDILYGSDSNDYLNGGKGADKLYGNAGDDTLTGGTGNDTLTGGAGNDVFIYESGSDIITDYTAGADKIKLSSGTITKLSYSGNDVIFTIGSGTLTVKNGKGKKITVIDSNNTTKVYGDTISAEEESDEGKNISNSTSKTVINGTSYADTISNSGDSVTIDAGDGDDYIWNEYAYYVTINAGAGNDFISNNSSSVKIDAGDGNDSIYSGYGDSVTINAGAGNDFIGNSGWYTTINAGAGNDIISLGSHNSTTNSLSVIQYANGDGNDIIYGYNSDDTISISGGSYSKSTVGNDVILTVGNGKITLDNAKGTTLNIKGTLSGGSSGKKITNSTANAKLTGTNYADTISNTYSNNTKSGDNVSIYGGAGNDSIYNQKSYYVTINAGDGADTIKTYNGSYTSISGGAGNDKISLKSEWKTTVNAGKGNDTIYGDSINSSGFLFQYAKGDGNDVITSWKDSDSITISGGTWSTQTSGNDVIVKVGTGNITLKGAKGKTLNIYHQATPPVTQKEVIQRFMKVLDQNSSSDGTGRLNYAVSVASGGYFTNVDAVINQMVDDCETAGDSDTFLKDYCGIDLSNTDTGAITGKDAGGTSTKTKGAIVPESNSLDTSFKANKFTTSSGLTVKLSTNFYSLKNDTQRYIWRGLKSWWMESALNLIEESYGTNFGFGSNSSATVKEITVEFYSANDAILASVGTLPNPNNNTKTGNLVLNINTYYFNVSDTSDSDGKATIGGEELYLDRTLAHEMTHAVMAANIDYFADIPMFVTEGMAELTHGIDDERNKDIQNLAGNSELLKKSFENYTLPLLKDEVSITQNQKNVKVIAPDYVAGYMFLRYLAKQGAENGNYSEEPNWTLNLRPIAGKDDNVRATVNSGVLTVDKNFNEDIIDLAEYSSTVKKVNATNVTTPLTIIGNSLNNSIKAGKAADTISANVGNDKIYGGAGNDVINGDAGNDYLSGDAGNDTLYGGTGKNTLKGGSGNDVFVHGSGNDVITDYEVGKDKIILANSANTTYAVSGKNVIFKNVSGNVTVTGGKGKNITVIDKNNNEFVINNSVMTAASTFKGSAINLSTYSGITKVTASKVAKNLTITGNASNNSLVGGTKNDTIYGGNGKDTIRGGKGADKIYGDAGNDYLYGDAGKDTIYGGAGNDSIFGGADADKLYGDAGNDTLYAGAGNDTLTGGSGKDIFVYESGNDFIADYKEGEDKIKFTVEMTNSSVSGENIVFTTSKGNVTVKGGKDKNITVIDKNGSETTKNYATSTDTTPAGISFSSNGATLTASNSFSGNKINLSDYPMKMGSNNRPLPITSTATTKTDTSIFYATTADASEVENNLTLTGTDSKNLLIGGTGDDTLSGGKGNDTLTGGDGNDVFVYSGGNDFITDYIVGEDKIKFNVAITGYSTNGASVIFQTASGNVTVQSGRGQYITVIDENNSKTEKRYSKANLWFLDDDNFLTDALNLDSITDKKFAVQNIETQNYSKLTDDKTLITFTEK